jgi:hypothetical protein
LIRALAEGIAACSDNDTSCTSCMGDTRQRDIR